MTGKPTDRLPAAFIFDCDGVLIDSWASTMVSYNLIAKALGRPPLTPDEERFVFASTLGEGIRYVIPGDRLDEALNVLENVDWDQVFAHVRAIPGVRDFLAFLASRRVPAAVFTNGGHEAHRILEILDLTGAFQAVVTADDITRPKPHPEGVFEILSRLGVAAGDAVYIGDSSTDEGSALAAGVRFWSYRNAALKAERHFTDFAALLASLHGN